MGEDKNIIIRCAFWKFREIGSNDFIDLKYEEIEINVKFTAKIAHLFFVFFFCILMVTPIFYLAQNEKESPTNMLYFSDLWLDHRCANIDVFVGIAGDEHKTTSY